RRKRRIVERTLAKRRRKARRKQQRVALAKRNVEQLGEMKQHLAARLRAAGLEKAQMFGGDLGLAREIELAAAAPLPPLAKHRSDGLCLGDHARESNVRIAALPLPAR